MLSALLSVLLGALAGLLRDLVSDRNRDRANVDKGGLSAQVALDAEVKEAADAQAHVNVVDRGGAQSVLDRLRNQDRAGPP